MATGPLRKLGSSRDVNVAYRPTGEQHVTPQALQMREDAKMINQPEWQPVTDPALTKRMQDAYGFAMGQMGKVPGAIAGAAKGLGAGLTPDVAAAVGQPMGNQPAPVAVPANRNMVRGGGRRRGGRGVNQALINKKKWDYRKALDTARQQPMPAAPTGQVGGGWADASGTEQGINQWQPGVHWTPHSAGYGYTLEDSMTKLGQKPPEGWVQVAPNRWAAPGAGKPGDIGFAGPPGGNQAWAQPNLRQQPAGRPWITQQPGGWIPRNQYELPENISAAEGNQATWKPQRPAPQPNNRLFNAQQTDLHRSAPMQRPAPVPQPTPAPRPLRQAAPKPPAAPRPQRMR